MPIIKDVQLDCEFFGIPYPLTRQGVSALIEAVRWWHEPEGAAYVGILDTVACRVCQYFDAKKSECRGEWKSRPRPCINADTPARWCPVAKLRPNAYLIVLNNRDLVMEDWMSEKEKQQCQNPSPDCSNTSGAEPQ